MSHRLRPSRLSSYRQGWRDNNNNPGAWQQTRVDLDWISILRLARASMFCLGGHAGPTRSHLDSGAVVHRVRRLSDQPYRNRAHQEMQSVGQSVDAAWV